MFTYLLILFAAIPFYLLGAFPTGRIVSRLYGVKIENQGSGNVGATNVARVVGKRAGIITLLADILKGFLATLLAYFLIGGSAFYSFAGFAAVAGHCFSIPGRMKGGKGVATALGVLIGLDGFLALSAVLIFLVIVAASRIVSIASVGATASAPLIGIFLGLPNSHILAVALMALLIIYRHKENLVRLSRGEEKTFSFKKTGQGADARP